jgi:prevent-host-death family protein
MQGKPEAKAWQVSEARSRFADVVDRALSGVPQVIRKRSGGEVVVVSKEAWDRAKPNLRDYLLNSSSTAEEYETFEKGLRRARMPVFRPGTARQD